MPALCAVPRQAPNPPSQPLSRANFDARFLHLAVTFLPAFGRRTRKPLLRRRQSLLPPMWAAYDASYRAERRWSWPSRCSRIHSTAEIVLVHIEVVLRPQTTACAEATKMTMSLNILYLCFILRWVFVDVIFYWQRVTTLVHEGEIHDKTIKNGVNSGQEVYNTIPLCEKSK